MKVLSNGYFSFTLTSEDLLRGLQSRENTSRNSKQLSVCEGAIGIDGALATLPTIVLSDVMDNPNIILDDFPFPQLFILEEHILVCNRDSILEYDGSEFELVASGLSGDDKWEVASSYGFIYITNGAIAVVRDPGSGAYSISSTAPVANAACNFNGQIIVGL